MTRFLLLAFACLSLASCAVSPHQPVLPAAPALRPAPALSYLRTEGRDLVDEAGQRVALRGCNIGGWLLIEPWMLELDDQAGIVAEKDIWDLVEKRFGREAKLDLIRTHRDNFFTEQDVQNIADHGMNCLRVPIWWRAVSDPDYGGEFGYLDRCIEWCKARGIYVIIDLHGAPGGQSVEGKIIGERVDADLWKDEKYRTQTIDWWKSVAARYKDEPAVAGYDLINEAYSAKMHELVDLYQQLYREIRAIDPRHILIIEDGLIGFHQLPPPRDKGWTNVVYSFHYYPQSPAQGVDAPTFEFQRLNRMAIAHGVPAYVGEFNTMMIERGGASAFRRYMDAFDYFGWSWGFWSYKKIERNYDWCWGLYGYVQSRPKIDLSKDSLETIREALLSARTDRTETQPLLAAALRQPQRWAPPPPAPEGRIDLTLRDVFLASPQDVQARFEWGRAVPNVGYWGRGDTASWRITCPEAGNYELVIEYANNLDDNEVRIRVDGIEIGDTAIPSSHGWGDYREAPAGVVRLSEGPHVVEISQGDARNSFVNLRRAWLRRTDAAAIPPTEKTVDLSPLNVVLRTDSPLRTEWWNNPPNLGFWRSGEEAAWNVRLENGGRYRCTAGYGTPNNDSVMTIAVDGKTVAERTLASTGDWQKYDKLQIEEIALAPGDHVVRVRWKTSNGEGAGNFRGLRLEQIR